MNFEKKEIIDEKRSFLNSALTHKNKFQSMDEFMSWFSSRKYAHKFEVRRIPFIELDNWQFEEGTGNLVHKTGKFFKIKGIRISSNFISLNNWDQPIIDQPEIGILGIITKVFEGVRYFLMQAKMEPGNINIIQLSPTVQATKSNYTQVHQGNKPLYLEYFLEKGRSKILVDQLQTEQGARFLQKRNRNIIVEVYEELPIHEDFCWLTLGQIRKLLTIDNMINMDSRSVISCINIIDEDATKKYEFLKKDDFFQISPFNQISEGFKREIFISMIDKKNSQKNLDEIINWFTEMKANAELNLEHINLREVSSWIKTPEEIKHESKQFFSIIAVSVEAENREVKKWTQPLIKHSSYGMIGFVAKKINNVLHFLVQARLDPCSFNVLEMIPTVACTEAEYKYKQENSLPFLKLFMNPSPEKIRYSVIQSDEGGRFYHSLNKYMVVELDEKDIIDIPKNYIWMTLNQIIELIKHNYFNIDARILIGGLSLV